MGAVQPVHPYWQKYDMDWPGNGTGHPGLSHEVTGPGFAVCPYWLPVAEMFLFHHARNAWMNCTGKIFFSAMRVQKGAAVAGCMCLAFFRFFQIGSEECFHLVPRNDIHLVIQIHMTGSGNDQKFLVLPGELLEGVLAEIA